MTLALMMMTEPVVVREAGKMLPNSARPGQVCDVAAGRMPALSGFKTAGCGSGPAIRSCVVEKIFAVINRMEADGVIGRYAIGGAVGAIFWLEPILTKDVDDLKTHLEA